MANNIKVNKKIHDESWLIARPCLFVSLCVILNMISRLPSPYL